MAPGSSSFSNPSPSFLSSSSPSSRRSASAAGPARCGPSRGSSSRAKRSSDGAGSRSDSCTESRPSTGGAGSGGSCRLMRWRRCRPSCALEPGGVSHPPRPPAPSPSLSMSISILLSCPSCIYLARVSRLVDRISLASIAATHLTLLLPRSPFPGELAESSWSPFASRLCSSGAAGWRDRSKLAHALISWS